MFMVQLSDFKGIEVPETPGKTIDSEEGTHMSGLSADIVHILHTEVTHLTDEISAFLFNEPLELDPLRQKLEELAAVCRLLELPAAASLVAELGNTVTALVDKGESPLTLQPELSVTLDIIPRMVRGLARIKSAIPFLFMPELASLRRLQGLPPLYEFQLLKDHAWPQSSQFQGETALGDDSRAALKKLKQLYQMGLLDILRGTNASKGAAVLAKVADKLQLIFTSPAETRYWSLVECVASAMARGTLAFNPVRMRLLAAVERQLKTLLDGPGGKAPYPLGLWRAFAILLAMVPDRDQVGLAVSEWCGAPHFDFTDHDINEARSVVFDGESDNFDGLVNDLESRLGAVHSLLERLDSRGDLSVEEADDFATQISELANLCDRNTLGRAASRLHGHHLDILQAQGRWHDQALLLRDIAHTVLYLECIILYLREQGFALGGLLARLDAREVDDVVDEKLVASSISAVWSECLRKLGVVKEHIDDYAAERDSEDANAILTTEFDDIRGAAQLAGELEVAAIARRCRGLVSSVLRHGGGSPSSTQLSAFADAVVALEYFFQNSRNGDRADFVLAIADDYLTELEAALP